MSYRYASPAAWQAHHRGAPASAYSVPLASSVPRASYPSLVHAPRHKIDRMTDLPKLTREEKVRKKVKATAHSIRRRQAAYMRKMARKKVVRPEQVLHWHDRLARTPLQRDMIANAVKPDLFPPQSELRKRVSEKRRLEETRKMKRKERAGAASAFVNTFARSARRAMNSDIERERARAAREKIAGTVARKEMFRVERENWEWVHDQFDEYEEKTMEKERVLFYRALEQRHEEEDAELNRRRARVQKLHNMEALKRLPLPELAGMRAMLEVQRREQVRAEAEAFAQEQRAVSPVRELTRTLARADATSQPLAEVDDDARGTGGRVSPPLAASRGSLRPDFDGGHTTVPAITMDDLPFFTTDPRMVYAMPKRLEVKLASPGRASPAREGALLRGDGKHSPSAGPGRGASNRGSPRSSTGRGSTDRSSLAPRKELLLSPAFDDALDALSNLNRDGAALRRGESVNELGEVRPSSANRIALRCESRESLHSRASQRENAFAPENGGGPFRIRSPLANVRDKKEVRRQRFVQYAREAIGSQHRRQNKNAMSYRRDG